MPKPEPGSKTAVVRTVVWFLAAVSVICCGIRFTAKSNRTSLSLKRLTVDDWCIIAALLLSILQSATVDVAVANGLGEQNTQLSAARLDSALRSIYASHFLYAFTLCAAKLSAVSLLRSVTPKGRHRWLALVIGGLVITWTLSAIFAIAFECHLPRPWDFVDEKCYNLASWWSYFEVINLLTDVALIAVPLWIICGIHSTLVRKIKLFSPFTLRIFAIAACIVKIYIWSDLGTGLDLFNKTWKPLISDAAIQCLEILSVCTIYLKQFLDSLDAGRIPAGDYLPNPGRTTPGFGETGNPNTTKNPLKSHTHEAYIRLQGEGRPSSSTTEKEEKQRHLARTATQAYRGRPAEGEHAIPLDHIEMRREVTIEEEPWIQEDKL